MTPGGVVTPGTTPPSVPDERVRVPDVTGMSWKDAGRKLRQSNLRVKRIKREHKKKKGTVFQQKQKAGTRVKEGTVITVYVSKGQALTPTPSPEPDPVPAKIRTPKPQAKDYAASIDKYLN